MNRFPDGARVCFVGHSIVHANLHLAYIAAYYRQHFPEAKVEFYNCGISGGSVGTILNSFDEDILPYAPTHVVLLIGINDSMRDLLAQKTVTTYDQLVGAFERFKVRLSELCDRFESIGVELILCTHTPYAEYMPSDEAALPGACALMVGYSDYLRAFAKERGYAVCDYDAYLTRVMQSETIFCPDRVHPSQHGHYHMAKCFLAFQGYDLSEEIELPQDIMEWHDVVSKLRDVIAIEHFILQNDFDTTNENRMMRIRQWLGSYEEGVHSPYFKSLCEQYIVNKPKQRDFIQFTMDFMKQK